MLTLSQRVMKMNTEVVTTATILALPILDQNVVWEPLFREPSCKKLHIPSTMKPNGVASCVEVL